MQNIIITLTTVPNRLLEPKDYMGTRLGLKTLLEQSYKPYKVHFNIPNFYKVNNEPITIPEWLEDYQKTYPHLEIYRTEDHGSITKILPTLERVDDPEAIIITADDDLYYMDGLIEEHLKGREKYPDAAIGFAGISSLDGSCHFCTTLQKDTRVKILEGYKTVSYKRKFFDLEELKKDFVGKSWRDDEILSAYMGYKNIPKIVLSYDKDTDFSPRVESFPVIGHTPVERGGCHEFRNSEESQAISESNINQFYKLGYLER
jgi:hypothetical protein